MSAPDKKRWPLEAAQAVADALVTLLAPECERIEVAGSVRRKKPTVGDVEILFIPKRDKDLLGESSTARTDAIFREILATGVIAKRPSKSGAFAWGEMNKLGIHVGTGIPVDFFTATEANWFNYLVCRTGPAESNMKIATIARGEGWKWSPYGAGFTSRLTGGIWPVESEEAVFEFVGLPFLPPERR